MPTSSSRNRAADITGSRDASEADGRTAASSQKTALMTDDAKGATLPPVWKVFLMFLGPMMLSNILQSLSGTINSVFLGHMIGVGALAAASAFFPRLLSRFLSECCTSSCGAPCCSGPRL